MSNPTSQRALSFGDFDGQTEGSVELPQSLAQKNGPQNPPTSTLKVTAREFKPPESKKFGTTQPSTSTSTPQNSYQPQHYQQNYYQQQSSYQQPQHYQQNYSQGYTQGYSGYQQQQQAYYPTQAYYQPQGYYPPNYYTQQSYYRPPQQPQQQQQQQSLPVQSQPKKILQLKDPKTGKEVDLVKEVSKTDQDKHNLNGINDNHTKHENEQEHKINQEPKIEAEKENQKELKIEQENQQKSHETKEISNEEPEIKEEIEQGKENVEPPSNIEASEEKKVLDEKVKGEEKGHEQAKKKKKEFDPEQEIEETSTPEKEQDIMSETNISEIENMWSPSNPDGKKQYSIDFLKSFSDIKESPQGFHLPASLSPLEQQRSSFASNKPNQSNPMAGRNRSFDPRMGPRGPPMNRTPSGGTFAPNIGYSQKMPKRPGNPKILPLPQPIIVELPKTSEKGWKRPVVNENDEKSVFESTLRSVRGILNKITVEKFHELLEEMTKVQITSPDILDGIIGLIFDKATDEPNFSFMYAQLCQQLQKEAPTFDNGKTTFRRCLLNKCQEAFENRPEDNSLSPEEKKKLTPEELEEYEYRQNKIKRRTLGNMIFIGELFKLQMLTDKIMNECVVKLLSHKEGEYYDERDLECLCNLLRTIGKLLDHEKMKKQMDIYSAKINSLSKDERLSSRIRFLLKDIYELRQNKWVPRREEAKARKLDEIRDEANAEQERINRASQSSLRGGDRRSSGKSYGQTYNSESQAIKQQNLGLKSTNISKEAGKQVFLGPQRGAKPTQNTQPNRSPVQPTLQPQLPQVQSQPQQQLESPKPKIDKTKFDSKMTNSFNELYSLKKIDDTVEDFKELKEGGCSEWFGSVISDKLNEVLDKNDQSLVILLGKLFGTLISQGILSLKDVVNGIDSVAEFLDDLAIDIPKIGDEIAAILLHVYYEGKLSLKFLTEFKFLPTQSQSKQVLATFFKKIDKSKLDEEIVQKNQISLYSILPKNIQEPEVRTAWLKDNDLSHLESIFSQSSA